MIVCLTIDMGEIGLLELQPRTAWPVGNARDPLDWLFCGFRNIAAPSKFTDAAGK
jgi:hypothetical protein